MNRKPMASSTFEKRDTLISVRIPESLKDQLSAEAAESDRTLSKHVVTILQTRTEPQRLQSMTLRDPVIRRCVTLSYKTARKLMAMMPKEEKRTA